MSIYKRICCTVVVCAIAATFSSCANSTDTGENTSGGVITIWAYDNYSAAVEKAVEIYKKDNPNCEYTFDVVNFGQDELVEKLKIALASDSVDLLPDLFYDEDYNFSEYVELHTDSFYNVSSYVADVPFYSYKTLNATYNDAYYAIPYDVCSAVMFYRTDLIHEAGYSDEDLNNITWDRYIEIGKDVKKKTGKDMLIMCPEGDMEGRIMYQSAGVWFYTNEGKPNMNSPAFRDAFTTMKKAYDEDIVYHSTSWDDYISAISNEKMVCLIGGLFWASILSEYTEQSGKWKITTIPRMTGNDSYTNYSNLSGGNWFVVNKDHSDFTAKFAAEMFAKNQELADFVGDQYLICPASEKLSSNLNTSENAFFDNQNVPRIMAEYNRNIPDVKYGFNTYEMTYTVGPIVDEYIKGKIDLDTAIDQMQNAAEDAAKNVPKT